MCLLMPLCRPAHRFAAQRMSVSGLLSRPGCGHDILRCEGQAHHQLFYTTNADDPACFQASPPLPLWTQSIRIAVSQTHNQPFHMVHAPDPVCCQARLTMTFWSTALTIGGRRVLLLFVSNVLAHEGDPKYRRVKVSNNRYHTALGSRQGGGNCMLALGFRLLRINGQQVWNF